MSFSGTGGRLSEVRADGQLVGEREGPLTHLRPVLDRLPHVGEHPLQLAAQPVPLGRVPDRVDLDPHPALDDVAGDRVVRLHVRGDLGEPAQRLPPDHHQRVHQQVHVEVVRVEQRGDRVDQERHVVSDDLDDGVVLVRVRFVDPQLQLARHPLLGEVPVRPGRVEHLLCREADQLLVRGEPPETADKCRRVVVVPGERDSLGHQALRVGNRLVELGVLHVVGQRLGRQAQIVDGVDARPGQPGDSRVEPAVAVPVGRRIEAVVVPAGVILPEVGFRFDRRTPVHRCHSPRPTALWVTLPPSLGPAVLRLRRRTTGQTSGSGLCPFTRCGSEVGRLRDTPPRDVHHTGAARLYRTLARLRDVGDGVGVLPCEGSPRSEGPAPCPCRTPGPTGRTPPAGSTAALTTALLTAGVLAGCSGDDGPQSSVDAFLSGWRSGDLQAVGLIDPTGSKLPSADVAREIKELSGELAATPPTLTRRGEPKVTKDIATATVQVEWALPGQTRWAYDREVRLAHGDDDQWQVIWEPQGGARAAHQG